MKMMSAAVRILNATGGNYKMFQHSMCKMNADVLEQLSLSTFSTWLEL